MQARYGSLPFQESIDFFRAKKNIPTERWADVWRDGHNNGFAIAGALKDDLLNDFRQAVDLAIAEGKSIGWFKKQFKTIRAKHGWNHTGNSTWRSKVIYNTNLRQAYNAGRFEQLQHFPIWEYQHGDSITPRPLHLSWHNLVLPKNHPWWQTHFPSNGWGCKCKVRGRTQAWLNRKGISISRAPNDGNKQWTDKATGEIHTVPKGIDPSFDYVPKKSVMNSNVKQIAQKKAVIFNAPNRIVPSVFSTVDGVNVTKLNTVLSELKETAAAPQVTLLESFIKKHQTKTVFIQQKEMNPRSVAATNIVNDIEGYLGKHPRYSSLSLYTTAGHTRAEGFTSSVFEHVTIKGIGTLNNIDVNELRNSVQGAVLLKEASHSVFTFAELLKLYGTNGKNGAMLLNWVHEVGHQVHFKAGTLTRPAGMRDTITRYAQQDNYEWHAEMFVAWLLDRQALANWNEDAAIYMDELIKNAIERDNN